MLESGRVYLGHLGPIPLYVHWSFLFLVLMAFGWAPPTSSDGLTQGMLVLAVLLLGIVLHELGHGFAARAQGAFGVTITLWGLGGLCSSVRDPLPRRELLIVAAGPAVSAALAWGSGLALSLLSHQAQNTIVSGNHLTILGEFLVISERLNWMLFIFNVMPIYPLDGGQFTYYLALLITRKHRIAATFSLVLACVGACLFLWWRTDHFTQFNQNTGVSFFMMAWLLFNAFTHLR